MKRTTMIILFIVIIALIYLFQYRKITRWFSEVMTPKEYVIFHYLEDGVKSTHYEVDSIPSANNVLFDSKTNQYILIKDSNHFTKIASDGKIIDSIRFSTVEFLDYPSGFLFGKDFYIDWLSTGDSLKKSFSSQLNADFKMDSIQWEKTFTDYYKTADRIFYKPAEDWHSLIFYILQDGKWFTLNTRLNDSRIYQDMASINQLDFKDFPERGYEQFFPLKNNLTNDYFPYSYYNQSNSEKGFYDLEKTKQPLELLHFTKNFIVNEAAYTNVPLTWAGTGYFKLAFKEDFLYFKEDISKDIGFGKKYDCTINVYYPPQPFAKNSDIGFIQVLFPSNQYRNLGGLYLIKKR